LVLAHRLYKSINDKRHSQLREEIMEALKASVSFVGAGINFLAFKLKLNSYFSQKFWYYIFNTALVDDDDFVDGKNKTEVIIFMSL